MHGEAAGAYAAELDLTQFSRQMLMLGADTIVLCDDVRLDTPRKLEWLLQTDYAAQQVGERTRGRFQPKPIRCKIDALEPQDIASDPVGARKSVPIRLLPNRIGLSRANNTRLFLRLINPPLKHAIL